MPKINRNGVYINYESYGQGPTVFLTHGFSATSKMWNDQIEELSKYFHLVVWDMRGHGQTDYPKDQNLYSEKETIEDIYGILSDLGVFFFILRDGHQYRKRREGERERERERERK